MNSFSLEQRIKTARTKAGLTQVQLAELVDVSLKTIKNYEKDASTVTVDKVKKIALECKVDEIWLLTGKGTMLGDTNYNITKLVTEIDPTETYAKFNTVEKKFDYSLLEQVIKGVENGLEETAMNLPSQKKAELISLLCKYFHESDKGFEPIIVKKYLRLVS